MQLKALCLQGNEVILQDLPQNLARKSLVKIYENYQANHIAWDKANGIIAVGIMKGENSQWRVVSLKSLIQQEILPYSFLEDETCDGFVLVPFSSQQQLDKIQEQAKHCNMEWNAFALSYLTDVKRRVLILGKSKSWNEKPMGIYEKKHFNYVAWHKEKNIIVFWVLWGCGQRQCAISLEDHIPKRISFEEFMEY
jgi:hypothetical protein